MQNREDGTLNFIIGRSGSGKTEFAKRMVYSKYQRVIAWDSDYQFSQLPGFQKVEDKNELAHLIRSGQPAKLAFQPTNYGADFAMYCDLVFAWAMEYPIANVVEELSDVASPGKATDGWGVLTRRLRKWGADTYALTQRPAETDKTTLGNAQNIVVFAPNTEADREYLTKKIGLPDDQIPRENLKYLIRDKNHQITHGQLTF